MVRILTRIADCLDDLAWRLFPPPKMLKCKVVCNISPFTSQYNAMACEYARMQREGASEEQLGTFVNNYPITSTEGQWRVPTRFPTSEENMKISAEILNHKYT